MRFHGIRDTYENVFVLSLTTVNHRILAHGYYYLADAKPWALSQGGGGFIQRGLY